MANLKVGKPDVAPDAPSHVPGIQRGGARGSYEKQPGHLPDGRVTAKRSTGINAENAGPIDPRMPNLPPA